MADIEANIGIGVDVSDALAQIRQLQREISAFHTSMAKGGALANAESARLSQNLVNTINAGGKFSAGMTQISSSTESFTNALEKNKLSMTQYFRYAGGASKNFGKMFSREFNTINRVATERVKDLQTQYISMGRDANGALQAIKVRPLALDMNDLGTKVQMVAQRQQIFNQLLKQGSTNLLNFGKNTQWAGRQLMVGFTIPLTIFGATAAREFQKLEEQAVKFRRVYGDMFTTDAETEKALANIRELADEFTKYGIAVEKTVGLAAKVAQMGNVGQDLTAQVTQATRLAVLGGLEQEEALDTTISLTNAFGVAAEDLAGKIAFLNAAENQTILAIEDFNEAIPKAGSVVQQLGGDVEDLAFMLTAMREGGINASQAANAIKSSLGRMINPTAAATEKLAGFGIDIVGIVESNVGDLRSTVTQLGYALDGLDPLNRARAIETLFGKFQFARMSTMFSNIVKEGSQANRVLELTTNSTEELAIIAERELKRVEESPAFKLQKQMEQLRAALAPVGAEFIKAVTPIIEFGTKILKSFNNLSDGGKQFIVALTAIAGVVAPAALMAFGLIANGVANLIKFFALLGKGFMSLTGSSRVLGTGTEYLTQQQIEAAAVAASLGQSHNNLIQVFSAEANSIRNLTNAYRQAITAQSAFLGSGAAGASRMPRPKGYATGGLIQGPGTPTSDSIIIRASRGEFIVNAEAAKRNMDVLNAINSGKIPGFALGGATVETARDSAVRQATRIMGKNPGGGAIERLEKFYRDLPVEQVEQALNNLADASSKTASELVTATQELQAQRTAGRSETQQQAHLGVPGGTVSVAEASARVPGNKTLEVMSKVDPDYQLSEKHSWVRSIGADANNAMGIRSDQIAGRVARGDSVGYSASALSTELGLESEADSIAAYAEGIEATGGSTSDTQIQQELLEYDRRIKQILAEKVEANANLMILDTEEQIAQLPDDVKGNYVSLESIEAQAAQEKLSGTQTGRHREAAKQTPREYRRRITQDFIDKIDPAYERGDITAEERDFLRNNKKFTSPEAKDRNLNVRLGKKDKARAAEEAFGGMDGVTESMTPQLEAAMYELGDAAAEGVVRGTAEGLDAQSPSRRMFNLGQDAADGLANGFEQGMADETGGPLSPPQAPEVGYVKPGSSRIQRLKTRVNDSAIGQGIGRRLSKLSGNALTDSQGNVTYDPNQDMSTWSGQMTAENAVAGNAPMPVRVVDGFELSPEYEEMVETGAINSEDLNDTLEKNKEATEDNAKQVKRSAAEQKEINRADRRQRRGALAGKMLGGLGGLTMAAGMATQVEGVVGETAQKIVGPLGALTGILPTLTALGPILGSLVSVIGLVVAGFFVYNKALKDTARETYELQRAMGASRQAIQSFAEFSGKVTQTELYQREQEQKFNPFAVAAGKSTFGESFAEDEAGQALVANIRTSLVDLGRDQTVTSVFLQLGQAVGEGALSIPEARSIATELGDQLGDMSFGMEVNANLMRLVGPGGEELLAGDRLTILADLREERQRTREEMQYEPVTGNQDRTSSSDRNARRSEIVESLGGGFGGTVRAFFTSGEWHRLSFELATGVGAAKDNMEQLSTILAQGVNDADFYASQMAAVEAQYGESLKEAYAAEDTYEINRLEQERSDELEKILADRKQSQESTLTELQKDIPKTRIAMKEALAIDFADDEAALTQYTEALEQIQELGLEDEKSLQLEYMLTSGDMPFQTAMAIVQNYEEMPDVSNKIINIQTKFGGDFSGDASELFNIFKGIDEELASDFVLSLNTEDIDAYQKQIEGFGAVASVQSLFPEGEEILLSFALENPEVIDNINERLAQLDQYDNKQLTLDFVTEQFGPDVAYAYGQIWESIPEEDRKTALYSILTSLDLQMTDAFNDIFESLEGQTIAGVKIEKPEDILSVIGSRSASVATGNRNLNQTEDTTPPGGGGGGEAKEAFDELTVSLRNLRIASIDMKRGWDGMQEALDKVFAGGTQAIGIFDGLANQMRRVGVGESLIERLIGMDPDEYEKRKAELFVFDAAGNIVGTTNKLKNMAAAMNAVALGEYVNQQQSFIVNTKNQFDAVRKLTAAGLSFAEAFKLAGDQALATAIAMAATKAEIKEIIQLTEAMTYYQKQMQIESDKAAASDSVKQSVRDYNEKAKAVQKLAAEQGKYTDAQITAIINDPNLTKLYLNPSIDPKSLKKALRNAENQANLEVSIAVSTEQGREQYFNQMMGEINDAFAQQENAIQLKFNADNKENNKIVKEAQNAIAAIQFEIDDYEAQLRGIEDQEESINEKYQDRFDALDEVAKANERINQAQQAQLDIADALSRGDIAAAARAQQQLRAQQAQDAEQTRRDTLQRQQEAELAGVRSASGQSREEIENSIKDLQDEVNKIEENSLEPAQERIRIAEYSMQLQVDALKVSGKTRDEWDNIASLTGLAADNTEAFATSVERALGLYEYFVNDVPLDKGLFPDPVYEEIVEKPPPVPSSPPSGGSSPAPAPSPRPSQPNNSAEKARLQGLLNQYKANLWRAQQALDEQRREVSRIRGKIANSGSPYEAASWASKLSAANRALSSRQNRYDGIRSQVRSVEAAIARLATGGVVPSYKNLGGMIQMAVGGMFKSVNTDSVPAMLTAGEYVVKRSAVQSFGVDNLEKINNGTYSNGSVYNYNLAVNVKSQSNPDEIARTVMYNIKRIDGQRIRGNKL